MRLVGEHLKFVRSVLKARLSFTDAGSDRDRLRDKIALARSYPGVVLTMALSLLLVAVSCAVLLYGQNEEMKKLSAGLIGLVIGYWLR